MTGLEFLYALINFVVLVGALYLIGNKMVKKLFSQRKKQIETELAQAEEARQKAKTMVQEIPTLQEQGKAQREQLMAESRQQAQADADQMLADSRYIAQQKRAEAQAAEQRRQDEMRTSVQQDVVRKVAQLTGEMLKNKNFDPYRDALVTRQLEELRGLLRAYPSDILRLEEENNLLKVLVSTPEALSGQQRNQIKDLLEQTFEQDGREVAILMQTQVEPDLLGGLRIQIGDTVYEGTIDRQLETLCKRLPGADSSVTLTDSVRNVLCGVQTSLEVFQVGCVTQVFDGICRISGLADCMAGEMLLFRNGIIGMVQDLERDNVGCVLLGDYAHIQKGDEVRRTGKVMSVPVGEAMIGRVVNALGEPVDGMGMIRTTESRPIESPAPSVLDRQSVSVPLQTGIKPIDALVPIGRGQRELIIGDRQTGKTAIALDAIINQKGQDVICIYVAIGQKESTVAGVVQKLRETGAMEYTTVVCAHASEAAPMLYIAPYSGAAMAEYFMYQGKDVLIIYDDLSKQAVAYRELSLILQRPPGREAYPGDVFYLHSRLLERAARLRPEAGGGSITALPIIETQAGDISAYIPTNVISITDGQIFLETDLFHAGVRPAVNVGLSVSRVGGAAQLGAMKQTAGQLRMDLAQYRELASFAQFGSDLDQSTRKTLHRGERMTEILKQKQYRPMTATDQIIIIFAASRGYTDDIDLGYIARFEEELIPYVHQRYPELETEVQSGKKLSKEAMERLCRCIEEFKQGF